MSFHLPVARFGAVTFGAASAALLWLATAQPARAASSAPVYPAVPCCQLCPRAADPSAYEGSKYLNDFRVLLQGKNGWLYRSNMDLATTYDISDESLWELRRFADALRARGTELVIVYQPPRGLMDSEALTPDQRAAYDFRRARVNYAAALAKLRGTGVTVAPLDRLVDKPEPYEYFFRRDHHWTPTGAEHTAQLVAEAVKKVPAFAQVPHKDFETHPAGIIAKPGTLQKIATQICSGTYSMQYVPAFTTDVAGGGSLLGEEAAPEVGLVGTSNSDSKGGYNFAGYLKQYLGADLINAALTGGSFEGSLMQYLPSEQFQKHPPKILIWEMPYQNYPSSDKNPHKVFRQLVALVNNGCAGRPTTLYNKVELHAGTNEVLFNGGGQVLPLLGRKTLLDVSFSDPTIKDFHAELWYLNGIKESLKLHFTQYVDNKGRFVAELRTDTPQYADTTLLGMTMDLDETPAKPLTVTAQLCDRVDPQALAVAPGK